MLLGLLEHNGSLILFVPLFEDCHLGVSCCGQSCWVGSVWFSQVEVMCGVMDEKCSGIDSNVIVDTTSVPWVKVAIGEDDSRMPSKVFLGISTSEIVESPVVFWSQSISILAILSVSGFVPISPGEPALSWVVSLWHWELIASLNIPSASERSGARWSNEIKTLRLSTIVIKNVELSLESLDMSVVVSRIASISWNLECSVTTSLNWPGWKRSNEVGWVWVVDHSHGSKRVRNGSDKSLDQVSVHSVVVAKVENLLDILVGRGTVHHVL